MSAYGALSSKTSSIPPLASTVWPVTSRAGGGASHVTIHHLTLARAAALPGLLDTLHAAFAAIIEEGMTYPQEILQGEAYTRDAFDAYFMAADVIVAVAGHGNAPASVSDSAAVVEVQSGIDEARDGRSWDECVAGFYYVKPNYPGRSSHICNGGFVVPVSQRGRGYGTTLARSFLHYAPALGYEASVFNLVYVNNAASVRLWEQLDFEKIGRIPRAGRLRRKDGEGEDYVDAWVFYKSFR